MNRLEKMEKLKFLEGFPYKLLKTLFLLEFLLLIRSATTCCELKIYSCNYLLKRDRLLSGEGAVSVGKILCLVAVVVVALVYIFIYFYINIFI